MLFRVATLRAIEAGEVQVAYRWWRRPGAVAGRTQVTPVGVLRFDEVVEVAPDDLGPDDALAAGVDDLAELTRRPDGDAGRRLYRVRFHLEGPDPRIALREAPPGAEEMGELLARLARLDAASAAGAWTRRVLEVVAERPGVVSTELARDLGWERADLKRRVRQLKALGLTESLEVGYRLSPRGRHVLDS